MFELSKTIELDAGHRVPFHDAGCRFLHGHRYVVTAYARAADLRPVSPTDPESGMVVDFGVMKRLLMALVHAPYDHRLILWTGDPLLAPHSPFYQAVVAGVQGRGPAESGIVEVPCIPTAEELARLWGQRVYAALRAEYPDDALALTRLEVRETPTSIASWYAPAHGTR